MKYYFIIYLLLFPDVVGDVLLLGLLLGDAVVECACVSFCAFLLAGLAGADFLTGSSSDSASSRSASFVSFAGLLVLDDLSSGDIPARRMAELFGLRIGLRI